MTSLSLKDVSKSYGEVEVLRNIDLEIEQGELIVFVGPSGCGKSTLLRMISGLEKITGGTLEIDDIVVNDVPPAQRGIAMVFQSYALYPHMTVYDNMAFALRLAHKSKEEIDAAVRSAAETLQLTQYLDRLPKALSGGQRQRVAICRSIVRDPKVFLFDEPLSNLDAALRVATRIEIAQLKESLPEGTMIYVTHDQVEAMTMGDRICIMKDGEVAQVGKPMDVYMQPANTFVASFLGNPPMNLIAATASPGGVTVQGSEFAVMAGAPGTPVTFGVRPEDLAPVDETGPGQLAGNVIAVEPLGAETLITADVGGTSVVVRGPREAKARIDEPIRLAARADMVRLFDPATGLALNLETAA